MCFEKKRKKKEKKGTCTKERIVSQYGTKCIEFCKGGKKRRKEKKRGEKEQGSNKDKKGDGYMSEKKMSEKKKGAPTFIGKELDGINTLLRGG